MAAGQGVALGNADAGGLKSLRLLGPFALFLNGEQVVLPHSAERLLAFLALKGRILSRSFISGHLWDRTTDERANASLRTVLWQLRSVDSEIVTADRWRVGLSEDITVDAIVMLRHAHELLEGNAEPSGYQPGEFQDDLLPDWYEEWVVPKQRELRQWRLQVLELLAHNDLERAGYGRAIRTAMAILNSDPLNENAHGVIIDALLARGNRAGAITHYKRYEHLLRSELGLAPSGHIVASVGDLEVEVV